MEHKDCGMRACAALLAAALQGCASLPGPAPVKTVPVEVVRLAEPLTAAKQSRLDLLYARPRTAHRELARLQVASTPGRDVHADLRAAAAAVGADALVVLETAGGAVQALAIEYGAAP